MRKGINYDVGTLMKGKEISKEVFDPAIVKREMDIIKNDLHCDSIRISGQDIERLTIASAFALEQGLEVWFSPELVNASEKEMLEYLKESAVAAQKLQNRFAGMIFVLGSEMTVNMRGFIDGREPFDRIKILMKPMHLLISNFMNGSYQQRFEAFLSKAVSVIRDNFYGKITYAAGSWENTDWSLFDFVGINYYRDILNRATFREDLEKYFIYKKPVVVLEFGCGTYKGAEDRGSYGWAVIDRRKKPYRLKEGFERDEDNQAGCLVDLLTVFKEENVNGAFVYTFESPSYTYSDNPEFNLDTASYSLVKLYDKQRDETYKNMPWDPKKSFYELAEFYAKI
jgi:hypothetical protein